MKYEKYTVSVSYDCAAYGSECTREQADKIAPYLAQLIEEEFPGIRVALVWEGGSSATGPEGSVCEEIDGWIQNNWVIATEGV